MNKDLLEALSTSLDAIDAFNTRLEKFEEFVQDLDTKLDKVKLQLESKIEASVKDALSEILDSVKVTNNIEPNNTINVDISPLADVIDRLMSSAITKPVTVTASPVKVEFDTKALKQLDTSSILENIAKQINESTKENRVLMKEIINQPKSEPVEQEKSPAKSVKVIRDELGLIQSLDIVYGE